MGIMLNPLVFLGALTALFVLAVIAAVTSFHDTGKQKKDVQGLLDTEIKSRQEMAARLSSLRAENEKLKSEMAVKVQMYEGLKAQYDELEKDFERMSEEHQSQQITIVTPEKSKPAEPVSIDILQPLEEEKPVPADVPETKPPDPQAESTRSNQSISDLIQNLQEIQKTSLNKNPPLPRGIS